MKEILEKDISILKLTKNVVAKLTLNKISTVFDLCCFSRMELTELKFTNEEIKEIIVKLQLIGLDIKTNHAKRNTLIENLK